MTRDFSCVFQGKQAVAGRSVSLGSAGFLAKSVGVIITGATLCVFCCSMFMGWMIQSDLNDLSYNKKEKIELLKVKKELEGRRNVLVAQNNISDVVGGMGLYPTSNSKIEPYLRKYAVSW